MKKITFLILSAFLTVFSFNHPEIEWKTVTSKHYSIIYNKSTEPALYACWKIAEEAYDQYVRLYKYPEGQKISLILADEDDYSNGLASWTDNTIKIWIPDSKFDLRDMNVWLRDVIYHEVAHIMSMEKNARMQLLYWAVGGGYYSKDLNVEYIEPIAKFAFMPMWFAEGTAQLRSDELGGDCRDSRREMVLRDAALNNGLLTLDEMSHFTHNMIGNELVYNQGYSFTKYLESNFGKKGMSQIWNQYKNKKFTGRNFSKIFFRKFNKSLEGEYEKWKESVVKKAESFKVDDKSSIEFSFGLTNNQPKLSATGDLIGFMSSGKDDFGRTDLYVLEKESKKVIKRIPYVRSDWEFSKNGKSVYYLKARKPNSDGSYFNDLFCMDLNTKSERKITSSARIYQFAVDEKEEFVYAVSYHESRFEFIKIKLDDGKIEKVDSPEIGEGYMTIDQKDSLVVLTALLHGKSAIYKYNTLNKKLTPLLENNAHEEDAVIGINGRIFYSADYDGVTNIYSVDVTGKDIQKHTDVSTGAFNPYFDGSKLWFSVYKNRGFRISTVELEENGYTISQLPDCKYSDVPKPQGKVNIKAKNYKPKTGRSVWNGMTYVSLTDEDDALQDMVLGRETDSIWDIGLDIYFGLGMFKSDPLEKKIVYGGVAAAIGNVFSDSTDTDIDSTTILKIKPKSYLNRDKQYHKQRDFITPNFKTALLNKLNTGLYQRQEEDSVEESAAFSGYFVAAPFWGIESRVFKPTIGIDIEVQILSMVPYGFYSSPFIDFQVSRDMHVGFSPMLSFYPILLIDEEVSEGAFAADFPLWMNWVHTGSINEDIQYNLGGVSFLEVFMGPQVSPQLEEINGDTVVQSSVIFKAGFSAAHYFPLFKYGSISLNGYLQYQVSSREMNSSTGSWLNEYITAAVDSVESKSIIGGSLGSDISIPIFRNINRGSLYADNLYGGLHYSVTAVASGKYLENTEKDLILDKDYNNDNAFCDHQIGLSLSLGLIKDYLFDRRLEVLVYRNIFQEETGVDLKFTF